MSWRVSVKSKICSYYSFWFIYSSSVHYIHTQIRDLFLFRTRSHTQIHKTPNLPLISLLSLGPQLLLPDSFSAQSEGQPGQVTEVALQWAIFLSLPKVCECIADESELWSSPHLLPTGSQRHTSQHSGTNWPRYKRNKMNQICFSSVCNTYYLPSPVRRRCSANGVYHCCLSRPVCMVTGGAALFHAALSAYFISCQIIRG